MLLLLEEFKPNIYPILILVLLFYQKLIALICLFVGFVEPDVFSYKTYNK